MKRTLFSLVLMLGLMLPAATGVMAQPTIADQTFVSEVTGDEVDLGASGNITFIEENYDFRETVSFEEEYIWFTYGWSNFQLVLIGGPNESADYHDITLGNMEAFYDDWELIDEEITDENSWFMGDAELGGSSLIVYYEFELDAFGDVDLVFMQFTDVTAFQSDLEYVQSEVTIGGEPLLIDTDAAELSAMAGGETSTPDSSPESNDAGNTGSDRSRTSRGGTDATDGTEEDDSDTGTSRTSRGGSDSPDDVDTPDDEDESDSGRSRTSRGGSVDTEDNGDDPASRTSRTSRSGTDDPEDSTNESETNGNSRVGRLGDNLSNPADDEDDADATPVSGGDWDTLGLISDTEWESPTYGSSVSWDAATWEFPVDFESAIIVSEDPPYDVLTLQTTDGFGYVYISVDQAYESTPSSMIDYWTSEEYSAQVTNGVTVIETGTTANSATLVYETTNSTDQPLVVVMEATFLDDGGLIFSQVSAAPDTIHEVYAQYAEGIEIDGAPLDLTFTVEDIRDITGN